MKQVMLLKVKRGGKHLLTKVSDRLSAERRLV